MRKAEANKIAKGSKIRWGDNVLTAKCRGWKTGTVVGFDGKHFAVEDVLLEHRDAAPEPLCFHLVEYLLVTRIR